MRKQISVIVMLMIWSVQDNCLYAQLTGTKPGISQQDEPRHSEVKDGVGREQGNKWAIKFSPQHMLTNKLRMELERSLKDTRQSIIFSPYMYFGTFTLLHDDDKLLAGGIEIMHKVYLSKYRRNLQGFYVSYGLNYLLLNFKFNDYGWKKGIEENGLEYFSYDKIDQSLNIHRIGFNFLIGYQFVLKDNMIVDFYHGIGVKRHLCSQGYDALERYRDDIFDYAADGPVFRIGVNIGVAFK